MSKTISCADGLLIYLNICCNSFMQVTLVGASGFMPPGTTATRWTSDMVLCYMDARSTGAFGPDAQDLFGWSSERFGRLL